MWGTSKPCLPVLPNGREEGGKEGELRVHYRRGERKSCANISVRNSDYVHGAVASADCT